MSERERVPVATLAWVASALGAVLLVASGAVVFLAATDESAANVDAQVVELDLVIARSNVELAALDVVATRLLDGVGAADVDGERLAAAATDLSDAVDELDRLADADAQVAREAESIRDAIDVDAVDDPLNGDLVDLFWVAEDARSWQVTSRDEPMLEGFQQLSFVQALPWHALLEGAAAVVYVSEGAVEADVQPLVDVLTEVVLEDGGWLAVDPPTPLAESIWFDLRAARSELPAATERAEQTFAGTDLVELDLWARTVGAEPTPQPVELADVAATAARLRDQLSSTVDASADAVRSSLEAEADASSQDSMVRLVLALVVGLIGAALLALGVRDIRRSSIDARERAALATRDALTRAHNRHQLEVLERALTADARLRHHLVAIVDLDRFKMVNDLHGHAAGDAVLVAVADRLRSVEAEVAGETGADEHATVRLGGDEFMLAFHSRDSLDGGLLRTALERVRDDTTSFSDEDISLAFSIGVAEAIGPADLEDLMRAADLAVYEDKAERSTTRRAQPSDHAGQQH